MSTKTFKAGRVYYKDQLAGLIPETETGYRSGYLLSLNIEFIGKSPLLLNVLFIADILSSGLIEGIIY